MLWSFLSKGRARLAGAPALFTTALFLMCFGARAGTLTLAWDANPDPSIAGYRIYYGGASGVYTNMVPAGTSTTVTISNLIAGVTYYFAATDYDSNNLESTYSVEVSGTIPVVQPNQPPTLNALPNVSINEGAGLQTVNLSGITSGATNENQTLTVTASSSNPGLIPALTVNYTSPNTTGTLTFAPTAYAFGSATISVTVNDGGASNNLVTQTFTVTVNPVNQAPTLNALSNIALNENAAQQTVTLTGISSGATNENQILTVTASSSNTGLIPTPGVSYVSPNSTGTLTFTPTAYAYGTATISVTVNDGGTSNNVVTRTFTVTVNSVNQAPTLSTLANVAVNENAGLQTVNLSGISSGATNENQTLTVTASSSNTGLIPTPTVNYTSPNTTGTVTFTPVPFAFGSATISVTVNDGGSSNNVVTRSFTVTVNPVNQPPTLNALASLVVTQNAGLQTVSLSGITSGATNENQTLTVTASSSNTSLIPNPTVNYTSPNTTGTLSFTPVASAFGSANISVTVNDGGTTNNLVTRSFQVTVDQPPTISAIANRVIAVDTNTGPIAFTVTDPDTAATNLLVSAASDNTALVPVPNIVFSGTDTNRTVVVTPAAGAQGLANITVTVSDGMAQASTIFQLTVDTKPAPPGNLRIAIGP